MTRVIAENKLDICSPIIHTIPKCEAAEDRPAPTEADFLCSRDAGSIDARAVELALIDDWVDLHGATTTAPPKPPRAAPAPAHKFGTGRPPKSGERHPCGKLRPADETPTDEQDAKRKALVGKSRRARTPQEIARHEALASCPLGVLYARRLVLSGELRAGRRYAGLFVRAVRPLTMPSMLSKLVAGGGQTLAMALLDEMAGQERHPVTGATVPYGTWDREQYLAARQVLDRRGACVALAVDDLVVYENPPRGQKRLEAIRDGLDALKTHFDAVDARSRAAR